MNEPQLHRAHQGNEGVGVSVSRLFPIAGKLNHDPFVLMDHFDVPPEAGFPDHPHRGFEAITYVMQGTMQHTDNLGNSSTVLPGGMQRFTAGRGIVHSEMPAPAANTRGIQLWINLPRRLKQVEPAYQQVDADEVPMWPIEGGRVHELVGGNSPMQLLTPVRFLDVELEAGATYGDSFPESYRGFIYVVEGRITAGDLTAGSGESLLYERAGDISLAAVEDSRALVCFGRPHREPIHQHGSFVD